MCWSIVSEQRLTEISGGLQDYGGARLQSDAMSLTRRATVMLSLFGLAACESVLTPTMYSRSVAVELSGPAEVAVGASSEIGVILRYSDGQIVDGQAAINSVTFTVSNPAIASVVRIEFHGQWSVNLIGLAPGDATVTATANAETTGTGARNPGTLAVRVVR
jgi:hypothetical protein